MTWTLKLDKPRQWPTLKQTLDSIEFKDPSLFIMRRLKPIEVVRTFPDRSHVYEIDWTAVDGWLRELIAEEVNLGLIDMLSPAEAERAKDLLLGFFTSAAAAKPLSAPPTTSSSAPSSAATRIE